jgi:hypothetical protein
MQPPGSIVLAWDVVTGRLLGTGACPHPKALLPPFLHKLFGAKVSTCVATSATHFAAVVHEARTSVAVFRSRSTTGGAAGGGGPGVGGIAAPVPTDRGDTGTRGASTQAPSAQPDAHAGVEPVLVQLLEGAHARPITCMQLLGNTLVTGSHDGRVCFWDVGAGGIRLGGLLVDPVPEQPPSVSA